MKRLTLSIIIGITLLSLTIAGAIITLDKTIPIDNKLDISKATNKYSYNTKYYSDGNIMTCVYKNETINRCFTNKEGKTTCYDIPIKIQNIGCASNDEEIKRIIEMDILKNI
jgi:hypothetical protein